MGIWWILPILTCQIRLHLRFYEGIIEINVWLYYNLYKKNIFNYAEEGGN